MISSRRHPLIQLCRELHSTKGRKKHGKFLVEGQNATLAARENGWELEEIYATPEILEYAADAQSNPQVLAIARIPSPISDFDLRGLLLVIDGVGDPGNVGTLLRAADAAGAEKVVLTSGSCDIWNPKIVRSAAGSLFSLDILHLENREPERLAALLAEKGIPTLTAEAHGGENAFEARWPARCALVLGHETRGVSPVFSEIATQKMTLPIYGRAESLNVAMAGTLLLYTWRQNQKNGTFGIEN